MILATVEGQLIFIVIMAFIGLINWITGKLNPADRQGPKSPSGGKGSTTRRPNAESEEERMRRFLEALGVPTGERPSTPVPQAEQRPSPPTLPAAPRREIPSAPAPMPARRPTTRPAEQPVLATRSERIALASLTIPTVPEFETISSKIAAGPMDFPAPREEGDPARGPSLNETLRAALASPQQLRSAFILSEIFGTPPGLRPH